MVYGLKNSNQIYMVPGTYASTALVPGTKKMELDSMNVFKLTHQCMYVLI